MQKKKYKNFIPIMMSPKCTFKFNEEKVFGKFEDTIYKKHKKYINLISSKKNIYDDGGKFFVCKELRINLFLLIKKAIRNINVQRNVPTTNIV